MAMASTSIPYILSIFLLFSCIWTQFSAQNDDPIQEVCSNAISPEFCLQTLRPYPRSATANLPGIVNVSLDLALSQASATKSLIGPLLKQVSDPMNRTTLITCSERFDRVILELNAAKKYLVAKDYTSVNVQASLAEQNMDVCSISLSANRPSPELKRWTVKEADYCNILCEASGLLFGGEYFCK